MSISIDIYPGKISSLTVHKILIDTNDRLGKLLNNLHKKLGVNISCSLNLIETENVEVGNYEGDLIFSEDHYLKISLEPIGGIVCLYCWNIDEYSDSYWKEKLEESEVGQIDNKLINECIATKKQWQIKREGEQNMFVDVVIGVIASSIASESLGFVHSTDFGWDPELLPCTGVQLFDSYLDINSIKTDQVKEWYLEAINSIE